MIDFAKIDWRRYQRNPVRLPTVEERLAEMERRLNRLEAQPSRFDDELERYRRMRNDLRPLRPPPAFDSLAGACDGTILTN